MGEEIKMATEEEFYDFLAEQKFTPSSGGTVLFVDDDPDQLLLFSTLLEKDGFEVERAGGASEALEILSERHVDLMITDIMMPEIDGEQLIHEVRTSTEHSDLPIIALTAARSDLADSVASDFGPDMFCMKKDAAMVLRGQVQFLLN